LLHGGKLSDFRLLPDDINAFHVADEALRTRDHAKEKQEYLGALRALSLWLQGHPQVTHVHLAEYDLVPVVEGLGEKLVAALRAEGADLMGTGVRDLTGSVHPHYLNFCDDLPTLEFLNQFSCREDTARVLAMLGCTSVWSVECLKEVAALKAPGRIYLEMAFPTLAHHLGWRVRPLPDNVQESLTFQGDLTPQLPYYAKSGAWMVHPCKKYWESVSSESGRETADGRKCGMIQKPD
jgi:hypothetical protein